MNKSKIQVIALSVLVLTSAADAKMKALIIDGQNNHAVWPKSTIMMKQYLEDTGLFEVNVARTKYTWRAEREKAFLPLAGVGETDGHSRLELHAGFGRVEELLRYLFGSRARCRCVDVRTRTR